MIRLVDREQIDLTVVGPEAPLGNGLADRFEAEGRRVFGPTRGAAQLETSKAFAKDFMRRHGVPTARYRVCASAAEALSAIRSGEFGDALVVKADGLAAGKGVVVAPDRATAEAAVEAAMVDKSFGDAGSRVVLEELLTGPEVSFFVVANGEQLRPAALRAGSQAHLRRRPGSEHRRHGRVLPEPADKRGAAVADRADDRAAGA